MSVGEKLSKIRQPEPVKSRRASVVSSLVILVLAIALGFLSKWLDNLVFDDTIAWHRVIETLDLGNVFSAFPVWLVLALGISVYSKTPAKAALNTFLLFAGMCAAYHIYTILYSGFNPSGYMMIWYAITLVSPLLAVACWYAKGKTAVSVVLDILILTVLAVCCFSVGWFYFGFNGVINAILFVVGVIILYSSPKQTVISVVAGIALAVLVGPFLPFLQS